MLKKRVLLLSLAIGMCILFTGCSDDESLASSTTQSTEKNTSVTENEQIFDIEKISDDDRYRICLYRDTNTDVLYIHQDPRAGLIEMHDPETGLPMTYERYKEMYHERVRESETQNEEQKDVSEVKEGSCPECGNKIEENAKFCSNCGAKQEVESNE